MSITRGQFLRSLGKSLPGMVASSGMAAAAGALVRRVARALPDDPVANTVPATPTRVPFWKEGPDKGNQIALTFDDGPVPGVTDRILDALKERQLTATFFMIGRQVADAPELARRVLAEGHEIGNHTYNHLRLTELSEREAEHEITQTETIFEQVLGYRSVWFRPPFGALRQDQARWIARRGMQVGLWSIDTQDWKDDVSGQLGDCVSNQVKAGSIVLCHDRSRTADQLPECLDALMARGFCPVTFSTILSAELRQPLDSKGHT